MRSGVKSRSEDEKDCRGRNAGQSQAELGGQPCRGSPRPISRTAPTIYRVFRSRRRVSLLTLINVLQS